MNNIVKNKKIFIAGCGGMLGEAFYNKFHNYYSLHCTDIDLNEKWITYLDFRDKKGYKNNVNDLNIFLATYSQPWLERDL